MAKPRESADRIVSLDQFRGYTVMGMLVVNFVGGYEAVPAILKHHNTYCSYADTIMPQFFFAVGFAYRLTFLKRLRELGAGRASMAVVRRNLGLALVGFVLYHLDGKMESWRALEDLGFWGFLTSAFARNIFQALVHIAVTSIWVLPVIGAKPRTRVAFLFLSAILHVVLSWAFYYEWVQNRPGIDGGPLGFLTWTIPLLVGSLAFDVVFTRKARSVGTLLSASVAMMFVGYWISCLGGSLAAPPFAPPKGPVNLWTMSQRTGSVSYLTFASGVSLAVYALFVTLCDRGRLEVGIFRTFGKNALAAYILHGMVASAVKPWVPADAPAWYLVAGVLVYLAINWLFLRDLETKGLFLRL